jgi:hypothetical protein
LAKEQVEKANSVDPVSADFPITALGVTSEAFQDALRKYVSTNPENALDTTMAVNRKVRCPALPFVLLAMPGTCPPPMAIEDITNTLLWQTGMP